VPSGTFTSFAQQIIKVMQLLSLNTNNSTAPTIVRLFLAIVLFPHGAQKLVGWFGGSGWNGNMHYFTDTVGLPGIVGAAVIIIEFFGPIAIMLGCLTRFWSIAIACVMTGIIFTNFTDYFFMNWFGKQPTEGMEFFLLAIGLSVSLVISGGGRFSVDGAIIEGRQRKSEPSRASLAES
jgi:putative oxidoreductase